ncbi:hypothetical protein ACN077_03240 [Clostridium chromiireducens]|uniref:hypothetical protein n=1 Tax=Clostridium chromiireducens TaxID=225345 RepID=UPI003AF5F158
MKIKELQNSFAKELISTSYDTSIDIMEVGLDEIFTDGILRELPVIKTINTAFKVGLSINDRYFAKKLIKFITELKNEQIDDDKLLEFRARMEEEPFKDKTTERLIIILDKLDEINMTLYISKLFKGFIGKKITWDDFCNFSKYINLMVTEDFELLEFLGTKGNSGENISDSEMKQLEGNANKLMNFNFLKVDFIVTTSVGSSPVTLIHSLTADGFKILSCII